MISSQVTIVLLALLQLAITTFSISTNTVAAEAKATNSSLSYPDFQHFNVREAITEAANTNPIYPSQEEDDVLEPSEIRKETSKNKKKWKLTLLHRNSFLSANNKAKKKKRTNQLQEYYSHIFHARMQRDVKRVSSLVRRLSGTAGRSYEVADMGAEVVSGMDQGSGEYFVRIGVGSPPRSQYLVIDSGSDIVWVQCQPCTHCYHQSDPVFDPADSASFLGIMCSSSVCDRLENAGCHDGRCRYEVLYGDGSYTKGTLAFETLTFGRVTVQNFAIGCGHSNRGMFVGAAGLLGLGGGSMSFVGQLGGQTGGAFSYCLVSRGTNSAGSLEFGREAMPVGAAWIPLIHNLRAPSFYYIGLSGLGVGGIQVPISEDVFALTELGDGGVVMDTGTAVTRLPTVAYEAFRDEFIAQTENLPRAPGVSIFDTCYNLNGFVSVRVPTVSFYFSGGPMILTLPARNFLIPVDDVGTFCFAFAPSPSGPSIIGNVQQEGIQISVDGANGFVGFGPNVC